MRKILTNHFVEIERSISTKSDILKKRVGFVEKKSKEISTRSNLFSKKSNFFTPFFLPVDGAFIPIFGKKC